MELRDIQWDGVKRICLVENREQWGGGGAVVRVKINFRFV
jgi:hypothetical protein